MLFKGEEIPDLRRDGDGGKQAHPGQGQNRFGGRGGRNRRGEIGGGLSPFDQGHHIDKEGAARALQLGMRLLKIGHRFRPHVNRADPVRTAGFKCCQFHSPTFPGSGNGMRMSAPPAEPADFPTHQLAAGLAAPCQRKYSETCLSLRALSATDANLLKWGVSMWAANASLLL